MLKSVLIANRGEIARRVIRTSKRLGVHEMYSMKRRLADLCRKHLRNGGDQRRERERPKRGHAEQRVEERVEAAEHHRCC